MPNTRGIDYKTFYAQEEEGRDNAATETRCMWCTEWSYVGTAAEGRERARKHRERKHPDAKVSRRRRKSIPARMKQVTMTEQDKAEIDEERRRRMFLIGIDE